MSEIDLWGDAPTITVFKPVKKKEDSVSKNDGMDLMIKDDKRTKIKKKKCFHVWKELDRGRVHKKNKGVPHVWYICKNCKRKKSRVKIK